MFVPRKGSARHPLPEPVEEVVLGLVSPVMVEVARLTHVLRLMADRYPPQIAASLLRADSIRSRVCFLPVVVLAPVVEQRALVPCEVEGAVDELELPLQAWLANLQLPLPAVFVEFADCVSKGSLVSAKQMTGGCAARVTAGLWLSSARQVRRKRVVVSAQILP